MAQNIVDEDIILYVLRPADHYNPPDRNLAVLDYRRVHYRKVDSSGNFPNRVLSFLI